MNKYRVYFNKKGQLSRRRMIDVIYGYSEDDALMRSGISRDIIESIYEQFV